jgi:hypothetical protein
MQYHSFIYAISQVTNQRHSFIYAISQVTNQRHSFIYTVAKVTNQRHSFVYYKLIFYGGGNEVIVIHPNELS